MFSGVLPIHNTMAVPYVINLDRCTDRWESLQRDWKDAFSLQRVSAVEASPGWVGCGLSHVKVVEEAKARGDKWVLVWEDDCVPRKRNGEYTNVGVVRRLWDQALEVLGKHPGRWDVILGATSQVYNTPTMDTTLSTRDVRLFRVLKGYTTHWTLYNASFFDTLIRWKDTKPKPIDVFLFEKARIFVTLPFMAEQRPCYSVIENKETNYGQYFNEAERALKAHALPISEPGYSTKRAKPYTITGPLPNIKLITR
jgi:hypothetical protein